MAEEPVLLTRGGLQRLEAELHELKTVRRAEVAAAIREAQELGPDQLDAQYEDAKNQQAFLEGRIGEIERQLENVSIIDETAAAKSKQIQVGSTVTVKNAAGKSQKGRRPGTCGSCRRRSSPSRSTRPGSAWTSPPRSRR